MAGECPAMLGYPWLGFMVEMGDIKAPNVRTVEAKCRAKWPPQGQAAERMRGPEWFQGGVLRGHNPKALEGTFICKPEVKLVTLDDIL